MANGGADVLAIAGPQDSTHVTSLPKAQNAMSLDVSISDDGCCRTHVAGSGRGVACFHELDVRPA